MKKLQIKNKFLRYFLVILFFSFPVAVLSILGRNNIYGMIIPILYISTAFPLLPLYLGFDKNFQALLPSSILRRKLKESSIKKLDLGSRVFFLLIAFGMIWILTIPFYLDTFDFAVNGKVVRGIYTVEYISSSGYRNIFNQRTIRFKELPNNNYEYYFAPKWLKKSERYNFTLFERSRLILICQKMQF